MMTPTYKNARKRMHSPERSPVPPTISPRLHYVRCAGASVDASRASRRKMLKKLAQATGTGNKILLRGEGAFGTSRFVGYMWIGPALLHTNGKELHVMDTVSACAIECHSSDSYMPRTTYLAYEASTTGGNKRYAGRLLSVRVTTALPCLRRVGHKDSMVVDHWAPHERLIYAQSNGAQSNFAFVASVDYTNCISCVYCGARFGKSTRDLCAHLNLKGRLLNTRFITS